MKNLVHHLLVLGAVPVFPTWCLIPGEGYSYAHSMLRGKRGTFETRRLVSCYELCALLSIPYSREAFEHAEDFCNLWSLPAGQTADMTEKSVICFWDGETSYPGVPDEEPTYDKSEPLTPEMLKAVEKMMGYHDSEPIPPDIQAAISATMRAAGIPKKG